MDYTRAYGSMVGPNAASSITRNLFQNSLLDKIMEEQKLASQNRQLANLQNVQAIETQRFQSELTPRWSDSFMGNPFEARQRAYTSGREQEELERLRMAEEGQRLQSQMMFQPQMEAIRGGIMGRMAGNLGVSLPSMSQPFSSGTGYTPSWMQNYQPPQFPRY